MSEGTPELVGPSTPAALVDGVYSRYPERVASLVPPAPQSR